MSVKIQYAKIDNISIQFNFTTIAYTGSLKEIQSQDRHRFISGNPIGEENPTKLPQYRCITNRNRNRIMWACKLSLLLFIKIPFITLKHCLPTEVATSIPMDVQTQGKALITNHKSCIYKMTNQIL